MFLMRGARLSDLPAVMELAEFLDSPNLPHDDAFLRQRLARSERAFREPGPPGREREYQFVLVDEGDEVVGTSAILSKHGTPEMPHLFLRVGEETRHSASTSVRVTHTTLQLGASHDGPTEIGSLVLRPEMRGRPGWPGRLLSWGRFAFIARNRGCFETIVLAEMRAAIDARGRSAFWDAFGRRFTGMSYAEADRRSASDKSFVLDLFPPTPFYASLLDPQVAAQIGVVHDEAIPALRLLEQAGLHWQDEIDPFDGGPFVSAPVAKIIPVAQTVIGRLEEGDTGDVDAPSILSTEEGGVFRAVAAIASREHDVDSHPQGSAQAPRSVDRATRSDGRRFRRRERGEAMADPSDFAPRGDLIDGRFVLPDRVAGEIALEDPGDTSARLGVFPFAADSADRAIAAARAAWPAWRDAAPEARAAHLRRFADVLRAEAERLARVIATEVGKPVWEARTEVQAMLAKIEITLTQGLELVAERAFDLAPNQVGRWRANARGVLAVLGPFNFPGHLVHGHVVPALATGNCVVVKPSEQTPATGQLYAEIALRAGLPRGVLNLVQGDGAIGASLCAHRGLDGVLFTGSWAVGRRILEANLDQPWKLVALEMGGRTACSSARTPTSTRPPPRSPSERASRRDSAAARRAASSRSAASPTRSARSSFVSFVGSRSGTPRRKASSWGR